jgi:Glycosyl transferase family 2
MTTISILMPCYNCEKTLERAVKSVLSQADCYELIMVNDASTDGTWALMQQIATTDSRIQIHSLSSNSGAGTARNIAAQYSTGDILGFLDADDEHLAPIYSLAKSFFIGLPAMSVLRFGVKFQDFPVDVMTEAHQEKILTLCNTFIPNMFIRKECFDLLGGFPNHPVLRKFGGEDGVLSYLSQQAFMVGTNYENQLLVHYWHQGVHAEKFLRTDPASDENNASEVVQVSKIIIDVKLQKLNVLIDNINQVQKGFMPVFVVNNNQEMVH